MGETRRKFSREFKIEAVRLVTEGGQTMAETARDSVSLSVHPIHRATLEIHHREDADATRTADRVKQRVREPHRRTTRTRQ